MEDDFDRQIADQLAFEDRFPEDAFGAIAASLDLSTSPDALARVRGWLLQDFYGFFLFSPARKKRGRPERVRQLRRLHEAAAILCSADPMSLPAGLHGPEDDPRAVNANFRATLARVRDATGRLADRLEASQAPKGRPAKNEAFRELVGELVKKYERVTEEAAEAPYWLPDSGIYGGKGGFWTFALAVWRCLGEHLPPGARDALPGTETALAEELRKHWPENKAGKNT